MSQSIPYDFSEAKAAIERATIAQRNGEQAVKDAYKSFAEARKAYQLAFAQSIVELRAEGNAATLVLELARGSEKVALARYRKDVSEGVVEAARSAVWRHTADRKDLARLIDWSRSVAPDGQETEAVAA